MAILLASAAMLVMAFQDPASSTLTGAERQAVKDVLFVAGLGERDLRAFEPPTTGSPYLLAAHRDPLPFSADAPARLLRLSQLPAFRSLSVVREEIHARPPGPTLTPATAAIELPEEIPASVRDPLRGLIQCMLRANEEVLAALGPLAPDERRSLIEGLPRSAAPSGLLPLPFVRGQALPSEDLQKLAAKIDLVRIQNAAEWLQRESDRLIGSMRNLVPTSFVSKLRFTAGGIRVVVAGHGDDDHPETDAVLTLDFGGNDRYSGRHGAGIGYSSIAVDFGGNDDYQLPDASLGVGILGIGLAADLGGRDTVRGAALCMGAGVAGVGVFRSGGADAAGRPNQDGFFQSTAMSQGFGLLGTGVMHREGGDDIFRAKYLSQGAGLDAGVGWLISRSGRDILSSPGLGPSMESDSVLRSRSQGFGGRIYPGLSTMAGTGICQLESTIEFRLDAGVEAQGCGIDEGVGVLSISAPSASSELVGYGQGYGARQGVGLCWGQGGSSRYVCETGNAQGVGTESGIGVLIDREGNDLYLCSQGMPGRGQNGGLGILFDFEGNDRFFGSGSAGVQTLAAAGMGLRVDLSGSSLESRIEPGPRFEVYGIWNLVGQVEGRQEMTAAPDLVLGVAIPPNSAEKIEIALRQASGLDPFATRQGRAQAFRDLTAGQSALLEWALGLHRDLAMIELRVLGEALRTAPSDLRRRCAQMAGASDPATVRRALRIAAAAEFPEAVAPAIAALAQDATAADAARALEALGAKEAASELLPRCASTDLSIRRSAILAISKIGGPEAISTAQVLLGDIDPLVRRAAVATFARLKPENLDSLRAILGSGDETAVRGAIAALGAIGSVEALMAAGSALEDRRPGVRVQALMELKGRLPAAYRTVAIGLRNDPDLRVRAVALWFDPSPKP